MLSAVVVVIVIFTVLFGWFPVDMWFFQLLFQFIQSQIRLVHPFFRIDKSFSVHGLDVRIMEKKFAVSAEGETFLLDVATILYIEAVDRKTFVYTEKGVIRSSSGVSLLQDMLMQFSSMPLSTLISIFIHLFLSAPTVRIRSPPCCPSATNLHDSLYDSKRDINRKIRVTMENGEVLMVSRQYSEALKKRLGI